MARIAELARRLDRGLDADTQNPAHDPIWLDLLADYEQAVDDERQTCTRRDHVGMRLMASEATEEIVAMARGGLRLTQPRLRGVR